MELIQKNDSVLAPGPRKADRDGNGGPPHVSEGP
jgi:hypothetical protein